MEPVMRKRIWEVDCVSMDSVIAATFDWRELVNILEGSGHRLDKTQPEVILEMQTQCLIHQHCHSENEISICIERLLNQWYASTLEKYSQCDISEVLNELMKLSMGDKLGGIFWALGTDPRASFDCLRRKFHQRIQVLSIRRFQSYSAITL